MITRRRLVPALVMLLLPLVAQALPPDRDNRPARHYILESAVPLDAAASAALAAQISKVTPLYSAPYNLTGDGIVMSSFEPEGKPEVSHVEFGGRVISHFGSSSEVNEHATHTSGTIVAAGVNAAAKGMAPTATLHVFDASVDDLFGDKAKLVQIGSVADNNSWDYGLSWQQIGVTTFVWYGNEDGYGAY